MKNTILVSAATAFVTTVLVLFTVAMCKGHGHGCKSSCGSGHGGGHGHGACSKQMKKKCKSACSGDISADENVEIEKKVIIKKVEEEN